LLPWLADLARQYPALIVATTRPSDRPEVARLVAAARHASDAPPADGPLHAAGANPAPQASASAGGTLIDLGPLGGEGVRELAAGLPGGQPGGRLGERLAGTAGNPLLVTELIAALRQDGQLVITADGRADVAAGPSAADVTVEASVRRRLA